ncbi:Signal peptidase complex subunit 3 [Lonchura striata]|uniref:Signal peptidase complex subunit 3 n=1 Tax=Lonchura striata TaxID=40157 RepID=A0A218VF15_9PASE|nr:Signal peptidase complex subunit 3 [Lonchura striata domestica]
MNTVLSRANSLFAFSLSVMAALTFGCFITTAFKERSVPVRIAVSRVTLKNVEDFTGPRERSDLGFVTFDITADILNGKNGLQTVYLIGMLNSCFYICLQNIQRKTMP